VTDGRIRFRRLTARMSHDGPWLLLVSVLFCLPLFVGLGRTDMQSDEAIYSFGADVMAASGDWLTPKSCPWETAAFLEKPPLKFWIVAAPIRAGLLPDNEFGLRFWDAVFGSAAFLYLFAIGRRIGGPMCGVTAALMLFVHRPLLFEHGLRSNNMEAALVLAYCGGLFHFLKWRTSSEGSRERIHVFAIALCFVLAFMTKFVAALFLPVIIAASLMLSRDDRLRFARRWRVWLAAATLAGVLIVPWFVYQHLRFGGLFWESLFGAAVYTRFTSYLDPTHVEPWHFYFSTIWRELAAAQTLLWTLGGLGLIVWRTMRTGWPEGATILLWFGLPLALMSLGTSKLYHYAYPFLPPLALAAGYLASVALRVLVKVLSWLNERGDRILPRAAREVLGRLAVRRLLLTVIVASSLIVVSTLVLGPVKIALWGTVLLRASSPYRVIPIVVLAFIFCRRAGWLAMMVALLMIAVMLPLNAYRRDLSQMTVEHHPLRSLRDCVRQVATSDADAAGRPPVYVENGNISHPAAFYLRTLGRWSPETPSDAGVYASVYLKPRPVLLTEARFHTIEGAGPKGGGLADILAVPVLGDVLLLPGPYGACAIDYVRALRR
jgi:4-amino-4-deoxy-L-arabinose transferase-like glycosyltransferase